MVKITIIENNKNMLLNKIKIYMIFLYFLFEKNLLRKKINFYNSKFIPKISIFLPIYNKEKYLENCIMSVQNQSLKNIEIIAVNDYSTDESLFLLKKLSKKDHRIKIINNDRNHGLLYTRAMGILNSTGEFVMNLDPDDEIKGKNNLKYIYKIAKNSKIDILSFAYIFKNRTFIKCYKYNKILKQPKLFHLLFNNYNIVNDYLIWNKLIKRNLFLKAYESFKNKIYNEKWNYHEDNIWSILIYKYANSMKCTNKVVYKYNSFKDSLMQSKHHNIIDAKNFIYKEEMFIKILNKKSDNKYIIAEYNKSFPKIVNRLPLLKSNKKIKNKLFKMLESCIKIYKCPAFFIKRIQTFINFIEFNHL